MERAVKALRRRSTAVVIGAGVCGLSAALALHRTGWDVTVLERASKLSAAGAGIGLTPNAVTALEYLGIGNRLERAAALDGQSGIRRPDGSWLVRTRALERLARHRGRPMLVMSRSELVSALIDCLPPHRIELGAAVVDVDPGHERAPAVVHTRARSWSADLVVAADGIRSAIRCAIFPAHPGPAHAGFTAWRMIVAAPAHTPMSPAVTWGRGAVFGIVPLSGGRLYCYATANLAEGSAGADASTELLRRFADWHDPIPQLIRSAAPEAVLRHEVWALARPLPAYHRGRVALLGDAAHAMTPNLSQGGSTAIEDALVLARQFGPVDGDAATAVPQALAAYTHERRRRTTRIARMSAWSGRVQQLEAPARVAARDWTVRTVGRVSLALPARALAMVAGWR